MIFSLIELRFYLLIVTAPIMHLIIRSMNEEQNILVLYKGEL